MSTLHEVEERAAFVAGLRELAEFLASHPAAPVPRYGTEITLYPDGDSDADRKAVVDDMAAILGTPAAHKYGTAHYETVRSFGPVCYGAVAVSDTARAEHEAAMSYYYAVTAGSAR